MGDVVERLKAHPMVGLDTCVFIYHFEAHPGYLARTRALLEGVQSGRWQGVTTALTIMELTVRPWQLGQAATARHYEALLASFPNLAVVDITRDVARQAAQLRALFHLRPADALQVAGALLHGATAFVTNDHTLTRAREVLDIVVLDAVA